MVQEEEQPGGAQLAPAELHAGSIILTVGGKPWARLDIGDAPGAAQWPFILPDAAEAPGQTRQEHCACCRLCHVQNDAAVSQSQPPFKRTAGCVASGSGSQ